MIKKVTTTTTTTTRVLFTFPFFGIFVFPFPGDSMVHISAPPPLDFRRERNGRQRTDKSGGRERRDRQIIRPYHKFLPGSASGPDAAAACGAMSFSTLMAVNAAVILTRRVG